MSFVEINGLDEAGKIVENIIFTRISVEKDFELHLLPQVFPILTN